MQRGLAWAVFTPPPSLAYSVDEQRQINVYTVFIQLRAQPRIGAHLE